MFDYFPLTIQPGQFHVPPWFKELVYPIRTASWKIELFYKTFLLYHLSDFGLVCSVSDHFCSFSKTSDLTFTISLCHDLLAVFYSLVFFFHSWHNYFCHFAHEQLIVPQWVSSNRLSENVSVTNLLVHLLQQL